MKYLTMRILYSASQVCSIPYIVANNRSDMFNKEDRYSIIFHL